MNIQRAQLPQEWEIKKLGEVCTDLLQGINTATDKTEFVNEGIPIFQAKEIGVDKLELHKCKFITEDKYKIAAERYKPKLGDILYNNIGSSMGRSIEVVWNYPFTIAWNVMRIIPDRKKVNSKFLNYLLQSPIVFDKIIFKSKGVGMPFISKKDLIEIEASYPPLSEQKRIVSILDNAFEAIDKAKANAEQNLKNSKELFESYLQNVFSTKGSALSLSKGEGWEEKKLGDVCIVTAGQSPEGKYYNKEGVGLAFYQGKKEFGDKYIGAPTTWTSVITKEAEENDILMSVRAPVGPINFATQKCCIGRGLAGIRVSNKIEKEYLFNFLLKHENEIVGNTGAVFNSINKSQIEAIKIPLPSLDFQKIIVQKIESLSKETKRLESIYQQKLIDLEELKKSLLEKAFKGELKTEKIEEF